MQLEACIFKSEDQNIIYNKFIIILNKIITHKFRDLIAMCTQESVAFNPRNPKSVAKCSMFLWYYTKWEQKQLG